MVVVDPDEVVSGPLVIVVDPIVIVRPIVVAGLVFKIIIT